MLIDREEFGKTLTRLKPALRGGGSLPAFGHLWFDGDNVSAYDGGFGMSLALESDLDCGVPGSALLGLLATSVLKEVGLEQEASVIAVKLGKSKSKLTLMEAKADPWPFNDKPPKGSQKASLKEDFIEALRKVLFVKSSQQTRVEHYGVTLECDEGRLYLYATDTVTLASTSIETDADFDKILLPRTFAEQIVSQAPDGVDMTVAPKFIAAVGNGIRFYSNVMDLSDADDMGKIVAAQQAEHPRPVELPPGLDAALARAEILSGKEDAIIQLAIDKSANFTVTGDYAMGKLNEVLDLEGKHPAVKFRTKASLLRRGLVHADSLSLTSDSLILRGEPSFLYVVSAL